MTVYLVGAGPGDPGLLTRRGEELLRRADVVVYDRLASPALLDLAPAAAERVDVGKAPGRAAMTQEQINEVLVDARRGRQSGRAAEGRRSVRVRARRRGGRGVHAARCPFEVVPGITSAIAAPAYAGIPVTHRGVSTSVTIVTGHEDPTKGTHRHRLGRARRAGGTLVVLMGAGHVAEIAGSADRRRPRRRHAGRRGAVGYAARAAHDARHARHDRRAGRRGAERDRHRRRRRARPLVVRAAAVVRAAHRRHACARAGERAACAARGARRGGDRAARRSRSSRSTSSCPTSPRTRGSCSRRPTASTPSSTAGSHRPGSTRARSAARASPRSVPGPRARSRGAASAPTSCPSASSRSRCSTRSPIPAAGARGC